MGTPQSCEALEIWKKGRRTEKEASGNMIIPERFGETNGNEENINYESISVKK
jgi:hypothetical protein